MKKPIRICFPFVGDSVGGAQLSTLTLVQHLPDSVTPLVVIHQKGSLEQFLLQKEIPFIYLPLSDVAGHHGKPLAQLTALGRSAFPLYRFLRDRKIDLVHTQDGRMHISWWLPARLRSVPHIWHQRSRYASSRLSDFIIARTTKRIAISATAIERIPPNIKQKTDIVFNPVAATFHDASKEDVRKKIWDAAKKQGFTGDDTLPVIAVAGNLRAVKQPLLAASAVSELLKTYHRPVLLAVFGEDRENWLPRMRTELDNAKQAANGQKSFLVDMGFRDPIQYWFSGCDILLATSNGDAFGRTLVEAMHQKIAVVAVAEGGHNEILDDRKTGFLSPDKTPGSLAKNMEELLCDKMLYREITRQGSVRAQDFSPGQHVSRMVRIYNDVYSRSGSLSR